MNSDPWVNRLFESIDTGDVDAFLAYLTEDVRFQFGNARPLNGKTEVGEAVRLIFERIKALSNRVIEVWKQDNVVICQGVVTYTRHDSSTLSVPFVNILKLEGVLIKEYSSFIDISEL